MAHRSTVHTALRALMHPASLAAIVLLLLNDHFLKTAFPSWLSGKLSDFAGLFFFPYLLALIVGSIWKRSNPHSVGSVVFATTALWFVAAKATLLGHQLTSDLASVLLGASVIIIPDPTDLLALLCLFPSWLLWERSMALARLPIPPQAAIPVAVIAAMGVMATSPIKEAIGVYQVRTMQGKAFAFHSGNDKHGVEFSNDHGATWQPYLGDTTALVSDGPVALLTPSQSLPTGDTATPFIMLPPVLTIQHPDSPNVWYRSNSSWRSNADTLRIDRSSDSGRTWHPDLLIPPSRMEYVARSEHSTGGTKGPALGVLDLDIFNDRSGVVIAAAGAGVVVRDSSGKWHQYSVNQWEALRPEATFNTFMIRPIRQELFALIGLALLAGHLTAFVGWRRQTATEGGDRGLSSSSVKTFGVQGSVLGMICGLMMGLTSGPIQNDLAGLLLLLLYVPAGITALLLLIRNAMRLRSTVPLNRVWHWSLYAAALALIAPLLVFLLWAFGIIEWYRHALIAAMIVWGGTVGFSISRAGTSLDTATNPA